MIKPKKLEKGDKIAIVSLSWGGLGDSQLIHKYDIAKERLENIFGLEVKTMPHALKGTDFIYKHPELRAKDLMDAFQDKTIKGIFCAIGGDDTVRLLPYINYNIIKNNPKIFMGYSDTTVNHFIMYKAGIVSYYGPCIMSEFGEYIKMFDYTKEAVMNILFQDSTNLSIESSSIWSDDFIEWKEENIHKQLTVKKEEHGYELLQGSGVVEGCLLGGCLDVFPMIIGTEIWPKIDEWRDKILLLETSEDEPTPNYITWYLRNLGAQGIFDVIGGIVVGKPYHETYYEDYKQVIIKVLKEYHQEELPVLYNINIGHSDPVGLLPLGTKIQIDYTNKKITLLEAATK
ncbi:MAG: LD-carboxypeptidase [Bacilli bacterium]|nr:LD-carboxypeptidase [Bacilli bacterium]